MKRNSIRDLEFFQQATLRICGSLEIEIVLERCLEYLKQYMPLDGIFMSFIDPGSTAIRISGLVSDIPLDRPKSPIPLTPEALQRALNIKERVTIYRSPLESPVTKCIWSTLGTVDVSCMVIHLRFHEQPLGYVELFAKGYDRFTAEHGRIFALIHDPLTIAVANNIRYRETLHLKDLLADDNRSLREELHRVSSTEIIGVRGGLQNVMESVSQVAPLTSQVLLLGETGVGKEIIANAIHYASPRRDGPFVKINCGAIPDGLIDSELFGHEKGAFTGALSRKYGRFERAHRGTIFLDEVGDLPPHAQVRLLRVLQEKEIERVGGTNPVKVDVRVIAATNRNLEALVHEGQFREDLWFRLNVFPILIPPLRERKSDIPDLIHHLIMKKSRELNLGANPVLSPGAMERLMAYEWPGNVREMENIVERSLIRMRTGDPTRPIEFTEILVDWSPSVRERTPSISDDSTRSLDAAVRHHIRDALDRAGGRVQGPNGAAALLGINPSTLRHRMRKLGIPFGRKTLSHEGKRHEKMNR